MEEVKMKLRKAFRKGIIESGMIIQLKTDKFSGLYMNMPQFNTDLSLNYLNFAPDSRKYNEDTWDSSRVKRNLKALNRSIFMVDKVNDNSIRVTTQVYKDGTGHNRALSSFTIRIDKLSTTNDVDIKII